MPGDVRPWDRPASLHGVDFGEITPTYLVGSDGQLLYANPAFRRIADAYALSSSDLSVEEIDLAIRALGRPLRQDHVLRIGEHTECFVSERSVVHDDDRRPVAVLGRLMPVTDVDRLEKALSLAGDRLDDLQRLVSDWVWESDARLHLTHVSERVFDRLGYFPQELLARSLASLMAEHEPDLEELTGSHRRRPFRNRSIKFRHKNGEHRAFELSAVCLYDEDGTFQGYRGIARDVTRRDEQFAALVKAVDDAEAANRAKTEFLANMSHELRTPLNAIMGFAQIMKLETFGAIGQRKYKEYSGDILDSSQHLLNVINDILDIAKIEAGKVDLDEVEVDIGELLATVERAVAPSAARAEVILSAVAEDDIPKLFADERRLRQVLLNILSNSVKFTPRGGRVDVSAMMHRDGVAIAVRDTGIGMDSAEIAVAMAPFGQVDSGLGRKYDGTGLGLPLSKALTELHGGWFRLESEPEIGTTVTIWLPPTRLLRQ